MQNYNFEIPNVFIEKHLLIINGQPGCGKSELLKHIQKTLTETFPDKKGVSDNAMDVLEAQHRQGIEDLKSGFDFVQKLLDNDEYDFILIDDAVCCRKTDEEQARLFEDFAHHYKTSPSKTKLIVLVSQYWNSLYGEKEREQRFETVWKQGVSPVIPFCLLRYIGV